MEGDFETGISRYYAYRLGMQRGKFPPRLYRQNFAVVRGDRTSFHWKHLELLTSSVHARNRLMTSKARDVSNGN